MKDDDITEPSLTETELTGLTWPKTWNGAYLLVICSFVIWLGLLMRLTESFS
jgi:hypothetical protein